MAVRFVQRRGRELIAQGAVVKAACRSPISTVMSLGGGVRSWRVSCR
jgi:hypothetical protein